MTTILVPVDYSRACLTALEVAFNVAARIKAQLLLCHIFQTPVLVAGEEEDGGISETMFEITESENKRQALSKLRKFAKKVKDSAPTTVPVVFTVKAGSVVEELHKLIRTRSVAMVVLGTINKNTFLNKIFGSTTERIMKEATCPVLAVPEKAPASPFGRIVYATALEPYEEHTLAQLVQAKKMFNSAIAVVYVQNNILQKETVIAEKKNNLLKGFAEEELIFSQIKGKEIAEGIEEYVKEFKADMVAVTVSQTSFWHEFFNSSVTSRLLHDLDLPLLAFPVNTIPINPTNTEKTEEVVP